MLLVKRVIAIAVAEECTLCVCVCLDSYVVSTPRVEILPFSTCKSQLLLLGQCLGLTRCSATTWTGGMADLTAPSPPVLLLRGCDSTNALPRLVPHFLFHLAGGMCVDCLIVWEIVKPHP